MDKHQLVTLGQAQPHKLSPDPLVEVIIALDSLMQATRGLCAIVLRNESVLGLEAWLNSTAEHLAKAREIIN